MSWTLCSSSGAVKKAGTYANSTITADSTTLALWSDEAESFACGTGRVDLITGFSGYNDYAKYVLQDLTSSLVAQKIILYDQSGYTTPAEAAQMLNILENNINRCIALLNDDKFRAFLGV